MPPRRTDLNYCKIPEWAKKGCHVVYRFYDEEDVLLYVGVTSDLPARVSGHRLYSQWFSDAARSEVDKFDTRDLAELNEAEQIRELRPLANSSTPRLGTRYSGTGSLRPKRRCVYIRFMVDDPLLVRIEEMAKSQKRSVSSFAKLVLLSALDSSEN